jgi:hypothetical protein
MSSETDREQLVKQIEDAFSDVEYPGDEKIVITTEYFDNLKLLLDFKGKHWKEINTEMILQHRFDLSRLTPEAFRFYLPAYLIASLRGEDRGEIIPHVIWNLDPQESEGNFRNEFLARVKGLSSKQIAAIKAFIKFFVERQTHLMSDDKRMQQFWDHYSV